jgi:hypothetical protein
MFSRAVCHNWSYIRRQKQPYESSAQTSRRVESCNVGNLSTHLLNMARRDDHRVVEGARILRIIMISLLTAVVLESGIDVRWALSNYERVQPASTP